MRISGFFGSGLILFESNKIFLGKQLRFLHRMPELGDEQSSVTQLNIIRIK